MEEYSASDLMDKIMTGQHTGAKEVFNSIMNDRVLSELGAKKTELAQGLLPSLEKAQSEIAMDKIKDLQANKVEDENS